MAYGRDDIYVQKSVITNMLADTDDSAPGTSSSEEQSNKPPPVPARPVHTLTLNSRPITLSSTVSLQIGGSQPVSASSHKGVQIPTVSVSSPGDTVTAPSNHPPNRAQYVNTDPNASDMAWAKKQAPALPAKSYKTNKVPPSPTCPNTTVPQRQESVRSNNSSHLSDDVFYENQRPNMDASSVSLPEGDIHKRRGAPGLTVDIPCPAGSRTRVPALDGNNTAIPVIVDQEEEVEFFSDLDGE